MTANDHARAYWQYEYDVAGRSMIPLLEGWGIQLRGAAVLDVGCGEGGGVCAMQDRGALCRGMDIDAGRIAVAERLRGERQIPFAVGNLYEEAVPFMDRSYDLLVLHDVFEHLDRKEEMLRKLGGCLSPGGGLMITFPPYYSAYGAHQQHLRAGFAKLPFIHLVPFMLSRIVPRLRGEHPHVVEEVSKLGRLKMGMRKFERLASGAGFTVAGKQAYLISPNHIRFGLTPLPAGPLASVPLLDELLCTGVVYLLRRS